MSTNTVTSAAAPKDNMPIGEAAKRLGITRGALQLRLHRGTFPIEPIRFAEGGLRYFPAGEVDALANGGLAALAVYRQAKDFESRYIAPPRADSALQLPAQNSRQRGGAPMKAAGCALTDSRPSGRYYSGAMADRSDIEARVLQACRDDGAQAIVDKLLELMVPAAALLWLEGNDPHLGGAQPIVVLKLEGSQPVLDALHAFEEGAFA